MSQQTPAPAATPAPSAPATPTPAPVAPAKQTFDDAYKTALDGQGTAPGGGQAAPDTSTATKPAQGTTPAPAAATPTSAAAKRLLKLKLDHEEREIDLEAEYDDETRRAELVKQLQKGYGFERAIERTREEVRTANVKSWNEWLSSHGYDVVRDDKHPSGWKLSARQQVTTPAAEVDPLTKEEQELSARIESGDATLAEVARHAKVCAAISTREALKERDEAQARSRLQETEKTRSAETRSQAEKWLNGEIDKSLAAHTKSFEGWTSRQLANLKANAFKAGETAAAEGKNPVEAANAYVLAEKQDAEALRDSWRKSLTATPPQPTAAPLVGGAPGGGTSKAKTIDAAYDDILRSL